MEDREAKKAQSVRIVEPKAAVETSDLEEDTKTAELREAVRTSKHREAVRRAELQEAFRTAELREAGRTIEPEEAVRSVEIREAARATSYSQIGLDAGSMGGAREYRTAPIFIHWRIFPLCRQEKALY